MDSEKLAPTSEEERLAKKREAEFPGRGDFFTQELERQAKEISDEKHAINLKILTTVRKCVPYTVLAFLLFFAGAGLLFLGTWVYHMLTPASLHWLDVEQIDDVQAALFSGASGVLVSSLVRKYLV